MSFLARRRSPRDGTWKWLDTRWDSVEAAWEGTRSWRVSDEPAADLEIYERVRSWHDYTPFGLAQHEKREGEW